MPTAMPLSFTNDSGAAIGDTQTMDATVDDVSEPVPPPAGLEPASVETKERALFRMLKRAVLEHPRHATLKDSSGTLIARGEEVIIYAVLEPAAPGGVVQYSVKRLGQVVGAQGTAGFQGADEFVVPEDWLRPKGTMATSQAAEYIPIVKVLQVATRSAGLQIPLFQRRYCWSEEQWQSLWLTVVDLAAQGEDAQHSLKRLLCLVRPDGSVVLDGQQRLTTVCVLAGNEASIALMGFSSGSTNKGTRAIRALGSCHGAPQPPMCLGVRAPLLRLREVCGRFGGKGGCMCTGDGPQQLAGNGPRGVYK